MNRVAHLLHQFGDFFVQPFRIGPHLLVADDSFRVDQEDGWPTLDIPAIRNGTEFPFWPVPKTAPSQVLFLDDLPDCVSVAVTVDADDGERLV